MNNIYFPCKLVEHEGSYSIILSDFHYFDDYFGEKEAGGYTIKRLAKKLAKENQVKGVKFDSEAGMFCAYSHTNENLLTLCNLLREITGEEEQYLALEKNTPLISLQEAEILLIKGFVKGLDRKAQEQFLTNVPTPPLSKKQTKYLHDIEHGTDEEKILASKRINSEARTKVRDWNHYLSHPNTITLFLKAIDKEENSKVYQELIWALVFICSRHLPDLRVQAYFLEALTSKTAQHRQLGLSGLGSLYDYPVEHIMPLIHDRSYGVREAVIDLIDQKAYAFPSWMFDLIQTRLNKRPKDFTPFFPLFDDKHETVQLAALRLFEGLEQEELFPKLKELIPRYTKRMKMKKFAYMKQDYQRVIEKLELMEESNNDRK